MRTSTGSGVPLWTYRGFTNLVKPESSSTTKIYIKLVHGFNDKLEFVYRDGSSIHVDMFLFACASPWVAR